MYDSLDEMKVAGRYSASLSGHDEITRRYFRGKDERIFFKMYQRQERSALKTEGLEAAARLH